MAARNVEIAYFSWVRERTGVAHERVALPDEVRTVEDLKAWLRARGGGFADAFSNPAVRAAADHVHVKADADISSAREVAFFPPVTGG